MKLKLFLLFSIGFSVVVLFWLLSPKMQPEAKPAAEASLASRLPQGNGDTKHSSPPSGPMSSVPSAPESNATLESTAAKWVKERPADIVVNQTEEQYPGSMTFDGITVPLGETPPWIHHVLKAKAGALLLGDFANRHLLQHEIRSVRVVDGRPEISDAVSISFGRNASMGGFVFKKDEGEVSQVGVIIPDVQVPPGDDPYYSQKSVYMRIESQNPRELDTKELVKIEPHALGPDTVVVMPTQPTPITTPVRVLWLNVDDKGAFTVANK